MGESDDDTASDGPAGSCASCHVRVPSTRLVGRPFRRHCSEFAERVAVRVWVDANGTAASMLVTPLVNAGRLLFEPLWDHWVCDKGANSAHHQ